MSKDTLPVHECFLAFQGEGIHMGRSAFFIRTNGCPLHCPFCDAAGTWHPNWIPKDVARMTPAEVLAEIDKGPPPEFIVITGGEPTIHDLVPLCQTLRNRGMQIHLETSGAFPIKCIPNWVTLSPKKWKLPTVPSLLRADEFKLIIETPEDISYYTNFLREGIGVPNFPQPVWLHPEWSHREDPIVLGAISEAVKAGKGRYRAGWQIHKHYAVDYRDSRSRAMVPLGGDLQKGY